MTARRLAIFLPSLDGGGAEKVVLALARQFVAHGVQCDLVIAMSKGRLLGSVPEGIRLVMLQKNKTPHAAFALARYLRKERPQTLLSTIFTANLTALMAGLLAPRSIRVVVREANQTEHDLDTDSRLKSRLNQVLVPMLYRRADAVIAVATSLRDGLLRACIAPDTKISVIRNPVLSSTMVGAMPACRDRQLILACGRLEPQKDHATLLRAFSRVVKQRHSRLVIVGEGSQLSQLRAQAAELGLGDAVTFAGFDPDPQLRMQQAAVLVHPSRFEGMSNVLIEAMANHCPIVATDCPGGSREVLVDGKYGTLVPVGDDKAIAEAILAILDGSVTFPDSSDHLRQFDLDRVTDAYLAVLFPHSQSAA